MKRLAAVGMLTMTLSLSAFAMNNYDDPRISAGFLDEDMPGALDILKVTLRAKESIEASIYLRDLSDVPAGVTPGYLFSLHQGERFRKWLVLQKDGRYSVYRAMPSDSARGEAAYSLEAHRDDLVRWKNGRITLNFALNHIDYAQDLEYDVSSVTGRWNGSSFEVQAWQDNLANERIIAKVIKPLQLFNILCNGRG